MPESRQPLLVLISLNWNRDDDFILVSFGNLPRRAALVSLAVAADRIMPHPAGWSDLRPHSYPFGVLTSKSVEGTHNVVLSQFVLVVDMLPKPIVEHGIQ